MLEFSVAAMMMPPINIKGALINTLVRRNERFCICMTSFVRRVMSEAVPIFCAAASDIACVLRKRSARIFVPMSCEACVENQLRTCPAMQPPSARPA